MKKFLIFIIMSSFVLIFLPSCRKEIAISHNVVWMTEDGSSWFICGPVYSKAVLNEISYSDAILANSPYDLMFFRNNSNNKVMVKFQYYLKKDRLKCVCTKDDNGDIGIETEFIFYPHNPDEDSVIMDKWRNSIDVRSDIKWVNDDGTSWFVCSETYEEAIINGTTFSDIDMSNFPNSVYFKKNGEYILCLDSYEITEEYVKFYCSYDKEKIVGVGSFLCFYSQK